MPDFFWSLIERLGVPLAFAIVAVWALVTERVVSSKALDRQRQDCESRLKEAERQRSELERDRDYYRRIAFEALKHSERLAEGVERAIATREDRP